ncbi:MAG: STAS domain-containing protein [Cyanobacteriota bacterium]|nr:STAS domain-containing protein [Cyanobacteriota bacterium]
MALLIRPLGDFNKKKSSLLQQKLKHILANSSEHCCVVDLATIHSINNYGLVTLVTLHRIAKKNGCNLYLINLSDPVKYYLELTGLDKKFNIKQNVKDVNYTQVVN